MNVTPMDKQIQILNTLIEGCSIRSTERMTGVHRDTITRLLVQVGNKCQKVLDSLVRNFHCDRMQVDEIWCYVKKKEKHLTMEEKGLGIYGDQYVFVGIDAATKLVPAFEVGKRTAATGSVLI